VKLPAPRWIGHGLAATAGLLGTASLLLLAVFLFVGSLNIVDLGFSETVGVTLNVGLCLAFFIQHSAMLRRSFRRWLARFIGTEYHAALYAMVSGVVLLALVLLWQSSAQNLVEAQGIPRLLLRVVFFLSIAGFLWTVRSLHSFDPFGLRSIKHHLRGSSPPESLLVIRGPYRWVRHPFYFLSLLMIWSCPDLTKDRLVFNVLWTAWTVVGTVLEERDLVACFGDSYRDYQRKVPILIPWQPRKFD